MEEIISVAEETLVPARCTRQSVRIAAQNVKFLSSPQRAALFTAGTASRSTENRDSKSRNFFLPIGMMGGECLSQRFFDLRVSAGRRQRALFPGYEMKAGQDQGALTTPAACPSERMVTISTGVPHCWMVATSSFTTTSAVTASPSSANISGRLRGR
jgi:orotidine-5'-phosphate decarboxylase